MNERQEKIISKHTDRQRITKMKITIICLLFAMVDARPHKRHTTGQLIEKQNPDGHQFSDVAWLFANHRNKLPSRRTRRKKVNSEKILAELVSRNLISSYPSTSSRSTIRYNQYRRNHRQVNHSRKRPVPMNVLRQFRHIMTNIPQ